MAVQNKIINVLGGCKIEIAKIIFTLKKPQDFQMSLKSKQPKICPSILRFILLEQLK